MKNNVRPLSGIELKPTRERSALSFRLTFQPSERRLENIEFELGSSDAMNLLSALQTVQRRNGWRVPQFLGIRGKPNLRIVKDEP
jgi:hypothetical protein